MEQGRARSDRQAGGILESPAARPQCGCRL